MGNKIGILQKIKIALFWFTSPTRKNILTVTCEFCGGTNIIKESSFGTIDAENDQKLIKEYSARYVCMNCKATCQCLQTWSTYKREHINAVEKIIQQMAKNQPEDADHVS